MNLFLYSHSPSAFGNVRGYRNSGSAQLVAKRIVLGFRKLFQQPIDVPHEFSCFLPSVKFLKLKFEIFHFAAFLPQKYSLNIKL